MVDQNHSFYLVSSLNQKLSLFGMAAFCLSTFYFWPDVPNLNILKYIMGGLIISYSVFNVYKLKHWSVYFSIHANNIFKYNDDPRSFNCRVLWVSPLFCIFYVIPEEEFDNACDKKQLIVVWQDMLSDINYRHLCRLLLLIRRR